MIFLQTKLFITTKAKREQGNSLRLILTTTTKPASLNDELSSQKFAVDHSILIATMPSTYGELLKDEPLRRKSYHVFKAATYSRKNLIY